MAHALSFKSTNQSRHRYHVPPPTQYTSPTLQMPNVFVFPPEEEQLENPPWCCFDANQAPECELSTAPDLDFLDDALSGMHGGSTENNVPTFHRTSLTDDGEGVVMPLKVGKRPRPLSFGSIAPRNESVEDIVEVVKVGRKDGMKDSGGGETAHRRKRSRTFKSRASKAFRSIKNVGKGSSRKTHAKDIWPDDAREPVHSTQQIQSHQNYDSASPTRPTTTSNLSRRKSLALSQLFHSPRNKSSFDLQNSPPDTEPISPTQMSPPHLHLADSATSFHSHRLSSSEDPGLRPLSPSPSTRKSRRRFSVLELHRLFSFSPTPAADPPTELHAATSTLSSTPSLFHNPSAATSTSTEALSERPDTPMDDDLFGGEPFDSEHAKQEAAWQASDTELLATSHRDVSFEMRLDSLHFDSLSFDPEHFEV